MQLDEQTKYLNPGSEEPPPSLGLERRESLWVFSKSGDERLSANFSLREFHCRCHSGRCHMTLVHPRLVESLQTLRELLARPLLLSSGYRCISYNRIVGGRARSYHTRGMAADVLCPHPEHLEELAEQVGGIPSIGGIGIYPLRRFVHLDVRPRLKDGLPERWRA